MEFEQEQGAQPAPGGDHLSTYGPQSYGPSPAVIPLDESFTSSRCPTTTTPSSAFSTPSRSTTSGSVSSNPTPVGTGNISDGQSSFYSELADSPGCRDRVGNDGGDHNEVSVESLAMLSAGWSPVRLPSLASVGGGGATASSASVVSALSTRSVASEIQKTFSFVACGSSQSASVTSAPIKLVSSLSGEDNSIRGTPNALPISGNVLNFRASVSKSEPSIGATENRGTTGANSVGYVKDTITTGSTSTASTSSNTGQVPPPHFDHAHETPRISNQKEVELEQKKTAVATTTVNSVSSMTTVALSKIREMAAEYISPPPSNVGSSTCHENPEGVADSEPEVCTCTDEDEADIDLEGLVKDIRDSHINEEKKEEDSSQLSPARSQVQSSVQGSPSSPPTFPSGKRSADEDGGLERPVPLRISPGEDGLSQVNTEAELAYYSDAFTPNPSSSAASLTAEKFGGNVVTPSSKPIPSTPPRRPVGVQETSPQTSFAQSIASAAASIVRNVETSIPPMPLRPAEVAPPGVTSQPDPAPRAMTPVMRMRLVQNDEVAEEDITNNEEIGKESQTTDIPKDGKADEERVRAETNRKWKQNKKVALQQKEEEIQVLRGRKKIRRNRRGSSASRASSQARTVDSEYTSAPTFGIACQNIVTRMIQTRCGTLDDTASYYEGDETVDEDEESDASDSSNESDSYVPDEERFPRKKERVISFHDEHEESECERERRRRLLLHKQRQKRSYNDTSANSFSESSTQNTSEDSAGPIQPHHPRSRRDENHGIRAKKPTAKPSKAQLALERVGMHDRNFIKAFMAVMTESGFRLLLHTQQRRKAFAQPIRVTSRIQFGTRMPGGKISEPRLVWTADDGVEVGSIDLFDIRSLEKASALQLESYPLAMPGRSVILSATPGSNLIFEANSKDSALRFVHGMRWIVARLAFNLIIGNLNISCELLGLDADFSDAALRTTESQQMKAMNDVSNHLADKALLN